MKLLKTQHQNVILFHKLTRTRKSINITSLKEDIESNLTCMENQPPEGTRIYPS